MSGDTPAVEVGQIWADKDSRMEGRTVEVVDTRGWNAWVVTRTPARNAWSDSTGRRVRVQKETLQRRFRIVRTVSAPAGGAHDLKTWPEFWAAVDIGVKTFEVRHDDRAFQVGDLLRLREFLPASKEFTGRVLERRVTYVLRNGDKFGVKPGFVVLGLSAGGDGVVR